ncbi:MAG: hypothetical protein JST00_36275 [Deltaproteobacteria bacterium]|nr:hypothetical protein [Deltaproteobacteria bacterium]
MSPRLLATASITLALLASVSPAGAQAAPETPPPKPDYHPAKEADPPLLPEKTENKTDRTEKREAPALPPLSTSGTEIAPQAPAPAPATVVAEGPAATATDEATAAKIRALEARIAADRARLDKMESDLGFLRNLKIQGFIQAQYRVQDVNAAASPNLVNGQLPPGIGPNDVIAKPDGTTTNTNLFRLRRTRLRVIHETDVTRFFLQIDVAPIGGPQPGLGTIARNAEATGIARWTKSLKTEVTGGLFMVPFRRELPEPSMYRPFIERSWAVQNMFPTERDIGVHVNTTFENKFGFDIGVLNGQRLGEPRFFALPDLNRSKDLYAAVEASSGPATFSVHGYLGSGVVVDSQQLRVKNYGRYGVNFALLFAKTFFKDIGESRLLSEFAFTQNMDTGINYPFAVPAIPNRFSDDVVDIHQRSFYLRVEQDVTKWALGGFRYESYTPDTSVKNNARDIYTFMAGARFSKHLKFINEVSWAIDNVHPERATAPSQHIFQYTGWLQGAIY